ncbi:unnamed protein product [Laminaria digitata]
MLNFGRSDSWTASSRRRGRGLSFDVTAVLDSNRFPPDTEHQVGMILPIPTLSALCLRSLESSLGKGLATFSLYELPLGLVEKIYEFVCLKGSRMAQMELSRALAPILSEHVNSLDFNSGAAKFLGDSALCELANGCGSGLVRLDLSACRFVTDAGVLGALLRCPAIRSLSLSGCDGVTDETAHHLPHRAPGLTKLNLAGLAGLTESGVAYISFLPALEKLCLARCKHVDDSAVTSLGAGACRHSLRWLDMTGTGVRDACCPPLRNIQLLEYVSLSSTGISMMAVAALARDMRLPAALPEAPKTRGRSNRTLLMGSKWSEEQLQCVPRRDPAPSRQRSSPTYYERGRRGWVEGPSKAMRLIDAANISAMTSSASNFPVKVGFRRSEEGIDEGGRDLLTSLVQGVLKLWPAVPLR